ncbi:MAG: helix-turn-helix transcriptional regulator [Actinomycetaceae bacterium]|nr:helix-turn-helix transcriptional regulator [Actinomycetaceae bacterium]
MSAKTVPESPRFTTADIVASNIRAEAARLGYTQVQLGKLLGMSQGAITKRWRGVTPWQLAELDRVANALGLSVVDLVQEPPNMQNATFSRGAEA